VSLAWATAADAATGRAYKGKTAQKKTIKFKVAKSKLKSLKFTINTKCSDGSTLVDDESGFDAIPIKKKKFSDDQVGSTDEVKISGKLKGKRVSGSITVTDKLNSTVTCTGTTKFSAKRK
jgi:uncharacterized protein YdeI (BOF family)